MTFEIYVHIGWIYWHYGKRWTRYAEWNCKKVMILPGQVKDVEIFSKPEIPTYTAIVERFW